MRPPTAFRCRGGSIPAGPMGELAEKLVAHRRAAGWRWCRDRRRPDCHGAGARQRTCLRRYGRARLAPSPEQEAAEAFENEIGILIVGTAPTEPGTFATDKLSS